MSLVDLYTTQGEALSGTPWDIYPVPKCAGIVM